MSVARSGGYNLKISFATYLGGKGLSLKSRATEINVCSLKLVSEMMEMEV